MNASFSYLTIGMMSLSLMSLSSCSAPPSPVSQSPVAVSPTNSASATPSPIAPPPSASPNGAARSTTPPQPSVKMTTINVYGIDSQCAALAPKKVTVAAKQSLEAAIASVLAETDSGDFSIAGYRVSREGSRAIVDLRLPANSKRGFQSLSSCEQLALFGGIRKTLTENSQWQIQSVQFTEKGQEIVL